MQVIDKSAPDCNCALRTMNYYSVEGQTFPQGYMRLSPHTDITCITLLFHRVGPFPLAILNPASLPATLPYTDSLYMGIIRHWQYSIQPRLPAI